MSRGPRALIFDFDGVIADDEPLHLAAFQEALAAEGITLSREAYYARYLGFDDHDAVVEALREAGQPAPPERVRALMAAKADRFLGLVRAGAPIFPGVPTFVRAAAARVPLAVASGALRHEIELLLAQAGLAGARRAGRRCLAVTNSYPAAQLAGADLIVSSLAEAGWDRLAALF